MSSSSSKSSSDHKSKFSEITTMTVMRNLKRTNEYNKVLQEQHNEIISLVETFWSECDEAGREEISPLLLNINGIQQRRKQVCSWETPLLDKDGKVVPDKWQTEGWDMPIDNKGDWRVSAKNDGMPRIHVTAKVAEDLKAQFKGFRKLKVF